MSRRHSFVRSVRGRLTLALGATGLLLAIPVVAASIHLHRSYLVATELRELEQRPPVSQRAAEIRSARARRLHARAVAITDEAQRDVLTLAALGLIAIAVGALTIPERLLRPLRRLSALVRQAQGGNLRVVAAGLGHDEIDELTTELSRVLQELAQFDELKREKIASLATQRDLLLNLLPSPAALVDGHGRALQVSHSFLLAFGVEPAKVVDRPLLSALGWTRNELAAALERATQGESLELELELGGCRQRTRLRSLGPQSLVLLTVEPI